jgi:hypothetical protein
MGEPVVDILVEKIKETKSLKLVQEGFASQVLLLTGLTEMTKDNMGMLTKCAFVYMAYGLMVEDDDPKYAEELYIIGKEYGIRALKKDTKFREGIAAGKRITDLVGHLDEKYAETLLWAGLNGGLLLLLNVDDPESQIQMADIISMVKQSQDLDPTYFHGAGKIFIAAYFSMIPSFLDKDAGPENAKRMFQEAREMSNNTFLLVDLFEARFLASSIDDEEKFDMLLNRILKADASLLPEARLLNELSKMKAKTYLDKRDLFF